jgi:hypothetical protein
MVNLTHNDDLINMLHKNCIKETLELVRIYIRTSVYWLSFLKSDRNYFSVLQCFHEQVSGLSETVAGNGDSGIGDHRLLDEGKCTSEQGISSSESCRR